MRIIKIKLASPIVAGTRPAFTIDGVTRRVRIYNDLKKDDILEVEEVDPISVDGVKWYQQHTPQVTGEVVEAVEYKPVPLTLAKGITLSL
jgi:hypothetical protein